MEVIIKIMIDGEEVVTKELTKEIEGAESYSEYARFFDESCPNWYKDPEYNLAFLKLQEQYATDKLKKQGYLFLNDVYDMLGLARTKRGQIVGWIYDPENPDHIGDNYVDFGLCDVKSRHFVNGYENIVLLDFNVDGMIIDKIS
jgi:hypothetical protein